MAIKISDGGSGGVTDHGNLGGLADNDHEDVYVKYIQNGAGGQILYQYGGVAPLTPSNGYLWWEELSA